ncbi:MAG: HEAT repeat domain-containing protein [Planctomycetota bacterium]|jgi:HEAT repeat protein
MVSFQVQWKTWWEINKWRFTWTPRRDSVRTEGESGQTDLRFLSEFLVRSLQHDHYDVRGAAALALGRAGSRFKTLAVPPLEKMVRDANWVASESAVLALGMLGSKGSVPLLVGILEDPNGKYRLRAHAAVSLGLIGEKSASRILMSMLMRSKVHDEVKAACMMGLALMREKSAVLSLVSFMNRRSEKEDLRAMAATALGKMGYTEVRMGRKKVDVVEELVRVLAGGKRDKKVKLSAIMAVSALGPSGKVTGEKLVDALGRLYARRANADVRTFILLAIAELGCEGRARAKARLLIRNVLSGEENPGLLSFACIAAGLSRDRDSVTLVRDVFKKHSNPELRSAAAVGLGLLGDVESTKLLLATIAGKGSSELKGYCCISLGLMGAQENREALPRLREILERGNIPELRAAAAMALTLLGDGDAVKILLKAVKEGNTYIRQTILMGVGYFRDVSTLKPLIELYGSKKGMNDATRAIVVTALGYITEEAEMPILKRLATHYNFLLTRYEALLQIVTLL